MSVDWSIAERVALAAAGGDGEPGPPPADVVALGEDAARRVAARTGMDPGDDVPPLEWISRGAWIRMNLASMRETLGPALDKVPSGPGPLKGVPGGIVGLELGAVLGLMGRRVLGQYDLRLRGDGDARRLVLVGPNLREAARDLDVDLLALTTWVAVHEATHAVQFGAAPWLRDHLGGLLGELLGTLDGPAFPDVGDLLSPAGVLELMGRVKEQGLPALLLGGEKAKVLDGVQAAMALIEGHAEWTMDAVGRDVVPDVEALRRALERRRDARGPVLELLDRLLGLELKLRQYRVGRGFCDGVVAGGGEDALRAAFGSATDLPTVGELAAPDAWLARTGRA